MSVMFRWLRFACVCCLLLALSIIGFGQNQPQGGKTPPRPHSGKIEVPFEFDVGGTKFPPGQYILDAITPSFGQIRSADGKTQQTLYFVQTGEPEKNPKAVFIVRNKKYFFTAVVAWFGRMQYTGFSPHAGDETQDIPITE
jgi:hypothetical protein